VKTISVGELRQNPTQALAAAEQGQTYLVTRHRRPVAQLGPAPGNWPSGADAMRLASQFRREQAGQAAPTEGFTTAWLADQRAGVEAEDPWWP
jgi:antitoxin (DNA-binding transcriptional repressor) of toxin-antitoxin stability system